MLHWLASKLAEAHFGVHLTHHLAQFRARLEKLINFPDLGQNSESLLGERLAVRRAGSRADTRVIPRSGCKDGPNRRWEDAVAPRLAEKFPCRSVTGTPSNLIGVEQTDGDINRNNVEIRTTVEDRRQGGHFPNDQSACLHDDDSPTARGAVDASDVSTHCTKESPSGLIVATRKRCDEGT